MEIKLEIVAIQREQQIAKVIEEKDWHTFLNMVEVTRHNTVI